MRSTSGSKSITIPTFAIFVTILIVLAPALQAQMRLGGAKTTVLAPRPVTPLQSGGAVQQLPDTVTLQVNLADPGPLGAETTTDLFFGHMALGDGYNTVFTLVNTGATPVTGTLFLRGQSGNPLNANIDGAIGTQFGGISVPPGGTRILTANPVSATDPLTVGWARFENIGGVAGGVGTFQRTLLGILTTAAGVLSSSRPTTAATIPVDNNDSQSRYVGFAVANPNSSSITITLRTVNEAGTVLDTVTPSQLILPPNGQTAAFLSQILPVRAVFRGSMVLTVAGAQGFAVVALVQDRGLLTAIPVVPEKSPSIP